MTRELSLAGVAQKVAVWRKTKPHRTSALPTEIAIHIQELAKKHKHSHIAAALNMRGTTINKLLRSAEAPLNKKRRPLLKNYSQEERLALCEEWKRCGMEVEQFCNAKGISKSALYRWQKTFSSLSNDKAKNWVLVKPDLEPDPFSAKETLIELILPNQAIARIKVLKTEALSFFQELYHAIAAVR